jgi:NADH-quinone oxidoreductase subunit G
MASVNLKIDDKDVSVEAGTMILEAAKTIGHEVPHYCYHPGLSIAGNCRMCLVQVEKMPKPVIACKTPVAEGMIVKTQTPEVKKMQKSVMEFLLINHPLDCPTCDQAGECRLQDYYMQYDRVPSRFKEEKVRKDKMVDLGAGVMLDEERCIVCTRCVRFCEEIAGTKELNVQERGDHSMVATFPGKKMENPYAGCTIDVCPVGALTSKDFRYKKRVWFLSSAKSVCPGCSRGCNIEVHHADNRVFRLKPRFNPDVNQYWMCDAGRYDYKFVNDARRLKPAYRDGADLVDSSYEDAMVRLMGTLSAFSADEVAFVASALESNEAIDAFAKFAEDVGGADEIYFSKNDPDKPFSDGILITADKNPNLAHVQKLGLKPFAKLPQGIKALVVQRALSEADLKFARERKLKIVLAFTTNESPLDESAEVVLPIPTYAEQSGHFTNVDGRVQPFEEAFAPRGEAKPIAFYLDDLTARARQVKRAV